MGSVATKLNKMEAYDKEQQTKKTHVLLIT